MPTKRSPVRGARFYAPKKELLIWAGKAGELGGWGGELGEGSLVLAPFRCHALDLPLAKDLAQSQ